MLLSKLTKVIALHKAVNDLHLHLAFNLSLKLKLALNLAPSTQKNKGNKRLTTPRSQQI